MQKTVYQTPELRDENDVIIQQGAFGKNTALSNATNDGWIDYVMNNLEALHETVGDGAASLDANGHVVEPANLAIGDEDGNRIKNSYLKLTGGSLSGTLNIAQNLRMQDNQENIYGGMYVPASSATEQYLQLYGGESTGVAGAKLTLRPPGDGRFELTARSDNGANTYTLTNNNNGALLWRGNELAKLASPAFTGTPTAPTPATGDNSTKVATTAFVRNGFLQLSGGTMSGAITTSAVDFIKHTTNDNHLTIMGGTAYGNSASILLNGGSASSNGGAFQLLAQNGSTNKTLLGKPDGQLTWGGLPIAVIGNNAGGHNSIYRGKNLGTSVTAAQWASIKAGTFDDMFIGDYWVINGITWRIAAFDYYLNCGDTNTTAQHVVIVPDSNLASCKMNDTNITTGAYIGSDYYTGNNSNTGRATAQTAINNAFGAAHILSHREYLQNAVSNGRQSAGAWYDSTFELMNEHMVYGGKVFEATSDGTNIPNVYTIDKSQLPLFALEPSRITNRAGWWLRSVVSATYFALVDGAGGAGDGGASASFGVRPAFAIYQS